MCLHLYSFYIDLSKKLEEINKKFVGEKATLTVKLEATKKECEQRAVSWVIIF